MGSKMTSDPEVARLTQQELELAAELKRLENQRDLPVRLRHALSQLRKADWFVSIEAVQTKLVNALMPLAAMYQKTPVAVAVLPSGEAAQEDLEFLELYREMMQAIHACPTREDLQAFITDYVQSTLLPALSGQLKKSMEEWTVSAHKDLKTEDDWAAEIAKAQASIPPDADILAKRMALGRASQELHTAKQRSEGSLRQNPFGVLKGKL